jgi:hypothetical protein
MLQSQRSPNDPALKVDKVYRHLLEKYVRSYDTASWTFTVGCFALAGYLMANTDKLVPYLGDTNLACTAVAITVIGVVGLLVKAINGCIARYLEFSTPHGKIYGEDESLAVVRFEMSRSLWLTRSLSFLEKQREAEGRATIAEGDKAAHVYWQPALWLVKISQVLRGVSHLMLVVAIFSFASGFIEAARGHDLTLAEFKAELNSRAEHLLKTEAGLRMFYQKAEAELKESYRKLEDADKAVVAAYKSNAAVSEQQVASAQRMLDIEKQRRKEVTDVLLKVLTTLRDHETTPEGKTQMDSLIQSIRSMDEPSVVPRGVSH